MSRVLSEAGAVREEIDDWKAHVVRNLYQALHERNVKGVSDSFAEDAMWRFPGTNRLAGEHCGKALILSFLGALTRLTQGTIQLEPLEVVTGPEHVFATVRLTAQGRNGQRFDTRHVHVVRLRGPKIVEIVEFSNDERELDDVIGAALEEDMSFHISGR